ncbi:MAG: hypothetical protein ABIO39_11490 [Caulobacteraceae bacterium]
MTHYMMDCYAADTAAPECCESFAIKAETDVQAIWEAKSAALWRKPAYFRLREVMRHGDRAIHDSRKGG